jgi:CTP synthase
VNPAYIERMTAHGLEFIGKDELGIRMEVIELRSHPFFAGTLCFHRFSKGRTKVFA